MNTLKAEKRSLDVKAKRLRREGYVVGNVFGREMKESIPVKMVKRDVEKLLKTDHKGSQIMLDVDGTAYDVLIKNVDYNPVAGQIDSIEFQALVIYSQGSVAACFPVFSRSYPVFGQSVPKGH